MEADKTIILGLDGAHFELISPWIESGKLPNIKQAIDDGVSGHLQSVLPPVTSPNWKAYATGKNPGKLGIFWWENIDMNKEQVYYPDSRKANHPEFWELIGRQSSAGVVNVPTTYPPREVNPFIVAGAPDAATSGYTHPPEIEGELEEALEYKVQKDKIIKNQPNEAANEIINLIDLRFRAGKHLLEQYDPEFLQITTFYINTLHHYFWDDERTLKGWETIDNHIGYYLDKNYNVVLMSDHGATDIDTVFHINTWLEQKELLVTDMNVTKTLDRLGITAERLAEILNKLGIKKLSTQIAPQWLLDRIPTEEGDIRRESKTTNIDWASTTALASGQGPIYIDSNEDNFEKLKNEIIEELSTLTGPNGQPIADNVYRGETVYHGPYAQEAPDVIIDQRNGVHISGGIGRDQVFTNPKDDGWKGENKRDGLFVATGPDITTGDLGELSILDLAPTILHLHGCALPDDLDGTVQESIFAEVSDADDRTIEYFETNNSGKTETKDPRKNDEMRRRLQDLGYVE